jgi:formylglycine-generating enzyme required for sulfatase activity
VMGNNPSHFKGASLPVETITWDEATAYCKAVEMRLPTEAEWEYAARGGNPAARYGPLGAVAWYSSNSGRTTHEVAQKQPNGYGLYDILGNVWEWAADWFDETYYPSSPLNDPQGPSDGTHRTLRGGSWSSSASSARASYRIGYTGRIRRGTLGKIFGSFGDAPNLNTIGVRCAGD